MRPRVDDYFPFGCGDIIREEGGRHHARVRAVVSNRVTAVWLDTGWVSYFDVGPTGDRIEKVPKAEQ